MTGKNGAGDGHAGQEMVASGPVSPERLREEMAHAFGPVLRGATGPLAFYFAAIMPVYWLTEGDVGLQTILPLSFVSALIMLALRFRFLTRARSMQALEMISVVVNLVVMANIFLFLWLHPEPVRLTYLLIAMLAVAITSASLRVIVAGVPINLVVLLVLAGRHGEDMLIQFAMLGFAGATCGFGLMLLMREAILRAVKARIAAEDLRRLAEQQADADVLTGLPNRRCFFTRLEALIADDDTQPFGLALIDLDGFKPVNDVYGHAVGDALLVAVGARLRAVAAPDHLVARLGGDEFGLLLTGLADPQGLRDLGRQLTRALQQPFRVLETTVTIAGSIGFAQFPVHGASARSIYERADHALYQAKTGNCGQVVLFSAVHEAEMNRVSRVEQALRQIDLDQELSLLYQPQYDVAARRTVGFEALARWDSVKLGCVPPDVFIRAAERNGMVEAITAVLLRRALKAASRWPSDVMLAFNLSARDIVSPSSIATIAGIVADSGMDPRRIEFEITETAMMSDFDRADDGLRKLAGLGCRIALDDFGSGYSSFSYINRFPLDKIKTDRSFIDRLHDGEVSSSIIRAMVGLSATLGFDCLVEGVETEADLVAVIAAGGRQVQGYHIGRPMAGTAVAAYLADEARRRAAHEGDAGGACPKDDAASRMRRA